VRHFRCPRVGFPAPFGPRTPGSTPGQAVNGDCGYRGHCDPPSSCYSSRFPPLVITLRNFSTRQHGGPIEGTDFENRFRCMTRDGSLSILARDIQT
jgi:hypothetical protein